VEGGSVVIVTGALLAEAAASVDNKLHVWGGVLDECEVGADRIAQVTLVVLTQAESGDQTAHVTVEAFRPSGDSLVMTFDVPEGTLGGENGFAYYRLGIQAETDGRYVLVVSSGGGSVSLPLEVRGT
jgi:hypothetical protein